MSGAASIQPLAVAPRLQIQVNGTALPALSASTHSNNYFHADNFEAKLLVTDPVLISAAFGSAFWMANGTGGSPVMVTVQIDPGTTLGNANWHTMLIGRVDHVSWNPQTGELDIEGRDRTADFIEAKTFEPFKNQTSSQVAQTLAGRHGMTAQVTATTTLIDRYYAVDHDKITLNDFTRATTEWDLLTFLGQEEGFDVFVDGNTLHFETPQPLSQNPFVLSLDPNSMPYLTANGMDIKITRALTLARDIQVTVQSWSSKSASGFKVTAKATGTAKASASQKAPKGGSTTQNYVFTRPNMTREQAQKFANLKLAELSRHERTVSIEMAGEVTLTPRQGLRITGTGTDVDMDLYIDEITRSIDAEAFRQEMTAKNQSPKDTSAVG